MPKSHRLTASPPQSPVVRFSLIVAVGLAVLLLPHQAPAATVTLTSLDGGTACHLGMLRATCTGNFNAAAQKRIQWKRGDDNWKSWDYISNTGDADSPVILWAWNQAGKYYDITWSTWNGPNVAWQFIVTIRFTIGGMPPTSQDADSGTVLVTVSNTVVTNTTAASVLVHHVNDTHPISWTIAHKTYAGISFAVTVAISNAGGGGVVRTLTQTQAATGAGNLTWDGKNTMGQDPGDGVYAYKIYAEDQPGAMCSDQDKSPTLIPTVSTMYYWDLDPGNSQMKVVTHYTLNKDAGQGWVEYFKVLDGAVTSLGTMSLSPDGLRKAPHDSPVKTIAVSLNQNGSLRGTYLAVLTAKETDADGKLNRDMNPKWALQCGTSALALLECKLASVLFADSGVTRDTATGGEVLYGKPVDPPNSPQSPQWLDVSNPLDLDADDDLVGGVYEAPAGDHKYPVCLVRNTQVTVTPTIFIGNTPVAGQVIIKGQGAAGLTFQSAPFGATGTSVSATITSAGTLPNIVCQYEPFGIEWQVSLDSGVTWKYAGTSDNDMFVVLQTPGASPYRTVGHLATKGGGTDPATCVSGTWQQFAGPANVCAWDRAAKNYNRKLYYYRTVGAPVPGQPGQFLLTAAQLLEDVVNFENEGQCGAWADLLQQAFGANGVATDWTTILVPEGVLTDPLPPGWDRTTNPATALSSFVVKNNKVGLPLLGARLGYTDDSYLVDARLETRPGGVPGQNTPTPASYEFYNHYVVHWGTSSRYYDPSYGIDAASKHEYTEKAIDRYRDYDGSRLRTVPASLGLPAAPDLKMTP